MSTQSRNILIVLAVGLVAVCGCAMLLGAAFLVGLAPSSGGLVERYDYEPVDQVFAVAEGSSLTVDSSAGSVTVRAGQGGQMRVIATKTARNPADLGKLQVDVEASNGGVVVTTREQPGVRNAWTDLEILVPPETSLNLDTASGSVTVLGIQADVQAHTSSGSVEVSEVQGQVDARSDSGSVTVEGCTGDVTAMSASGGVEVRDVLGSVDATSRSGGVYASDILGPVRLHTNSGGVEYRGPLRGECRFTTNSGSIEITGPSELNAEVDLGTESGAVEVDYDVTGRLSERSVKGVIGTGQEATIYAHTPSGGVYLLR